MEVVVDVTMDVVVVRVLFDVEDDDPVVVDVSLADISCTAVGDMTVGLTGCNEKRNGFRLLLPPLHHHHPQHSANVDV